MGSLIVLCLSNIFNLWIFPQIYFFHQFEKVVCVSLCCAHFFHFGSLSHQTSSKMWIIEQILSPGKKIIFFLPLAAALDFLFDFPLCFKQHTAVAAGSGGGGGVWHVNVNEIKWEPLAAAGVSWWNEGSESRLLLSLSRHFGSFCFGFGFFFCSLPFFLFWPDQTVVTCFTLPPSSQLRRQLSALVAVFPLFVISCFDYNCNSPPPQLPLFSSPHFPPPTPTPSSPVLPSFIR